MMLSTAPIKALHAESPLRVWSLIVTIFGDVVMQQGQRQSPPSIWSGALLELLDLFGIDAGLVRTSLSRLVANGTLIRIKAGRNTFYELAAPSRAAFMQAAELIYGRQSKAQDSVLFMVSIDRCENRAKARDALTTSGIRFFGPTVGLGFGNPDDQALHLPQHSLLSIPKPSEDMFIAVRETWNLHELNQSYGRFLDVFSAIKKQPQFSPEEAITTRILLVHQFRRLRLRDPDMISAALPQQWLGQEARQFFDANCEKLSEQSEAWLSQSGFLSGEVTP